MPTNAKYGTTTAGIFSDDGLMALNQSKVKHFVALFTEWKKYTDAFLLFLFGKGKETTKHYVYISIIG